MRSLKVILSLFLLFIFLGCCSSGTNKGNVTVKYLWEAHTENWKHKGHPYSRDYDDSYVVVITHEDDAQMVTVTKSIYDLVLVGDSIRLTNKGIMHNSSEPIKSPYVKLNKALNGPNHYYRRYWPRRPCGSRG